ncbi:PrsW family glutamic-type intramembrane protease [Lacrimispora sp. NSJ-141]|uniref:PrsW family glutamic-type intramembrane protease n=1 Tax=Lientehia hominis TaxID=2897778 RepID=A0AAP2RIW5_9FIRM|nr:PrsW family glutamic-type intramembrane protease [Lientehia hominis]MCD2493022.1 PrsW family glutamic-type intramembrane protease [Lientehia hominis]
MNCSRCGNPIPEGADRCPHCSSSVRYGGNTEFFGKAAASGLHFKDIFSDVFKKHPKSDGERLFMAGTQQTTPREDEMLREWRKPWVFAWVGIVGIILTVVLYFMSSYMRSYAAFMTVGSFIMPITALLFYWEMNIPRNIPLYEVILMFLAGGVLSFFISMILFQVISTETASFAAFCEEPAKLLALAFFLRKSDKKYILNGILIGGAVGAGFSAIESLGYAFDYAAVGGEVYGTATVVLRGVLSPGGHVVWAAIYGGALAMVKGREPLKGPHFIDLNFLKYFFISVVLHFIWNSGISLVPLPIVGDLSYVLLTVAAWVALFWIMNKGIRQIVDITNSYGSIPAGYGRPRAAAPLSAAAGEQAVSRSGPAMLVGIGGVYAGQTISCQPGQLVFGREPSVCNLVFPSGIPGISRKHCILELKNGNFFLSDCGSTYGTFLGDGRRLNTGEQVLLQSGQQFYMGHEVFEVRN